MFSPAKQCLNAQCFRIDSEPTQGRLRVDSESLRTLRGRKKKVWLTPHQIHSSPYHEVSVHPSSHHAPRGRDGLRRYSRLPLKSDDVHTAQNAPKRGNCSRRLCMKNVQFAYTPRIRRVSAEDRKFIAHSQSACPFEHLSMLLQGRGRALHAFKRGWIEVRTPAHVLKLPRPNSVGSVDRMRTCLLCHDMENARVSSRPW